MKNGSKPINIYSFSNRIRIQIQNWTKTTTKPDVDQFVKKRTFIEIRPLWICIGADALARPFK